MATLYPDCFRPDLDKLPDGVRAEWSVALLLEKELPEGWQIFHGLNYESADRKGGDGIWEGELDLTILSPSGDLLILEVKAGALIWENGTAYRQYGKRRSDVGEQLKRQHASMHAKLNEAQIASFVNNALVLPDSLAPEGFSVLKHPGNRIIDQSDLPNIREVVEEILSSKGSKGVPRPNVVEQMTHFLKSEFRITLQPQLLIAAIQGETARLKEAQATWLSRLRLPPGGALLIEAVAGSGKSDLAERWLGAAMLRDENWRYICFNNSLATKMRERLPLGVRMVTTMNDLAIEALKKKRLIAQEEYRTGSVFKDSIAALAEDRGWAEGLDGVVVDEAVDISNELFEALKKNAPPQCRWLILFDSDQKIQGDPSEEELHWLDQHFNHAVRFEQRENFHSPKKVVEEINRLHLAKKRVIPCNTYVGEQPKYFLYPEGDEERMLEHTEAAIREWQEVSVPPREMALITFRGRENSQLLKQQCIGEVQLKKPTDRYNEYGEQQYTDGELLIDTVRRVKGLFAPYVILSEVDWELFNSIERRKLYVGMTRAEVGLAIVISTRVYEELQRRAEEKNFFSQTII